MASYSQELKDSIVTRLITGETSASDLARETGISINTIYRWRDKAKKKAFHLQQSSKQQISGAHRISFRLY